MTLLGRHSIKRQKSQLSNTVFSKCTHLDFWPSANLSRVCLHRWILHKSLFHTLWNSITSQLSYSQAASLLLDLFSKGLVLKLFPHHFLWKFFPSHWLLVKTTRGELRKEKHLERKCYPDSKTKTYSWEHCIDYKNNAFICNAINFCSRNNTTSLIYLTYYPSRDSTTLKCILKIDWYWNWKCTEN